MANSVTHWLSFCTYRPCMAQVALSCKVTPYTYRTFIKKVIQNNVTQKHSKRPKSLYSWRLLSALPLLLFLLLLAFLLFPSTRTSWTFLFRCHLLRKYLWSRRFHIRFALFNTARPQYITHCIYHSFPRSVLYRKRLTRDIHTLILDDS